MNNNSSVNTEISHELDNFITLQQQLQHSQTITIHQLSQSIKSSNPSTPTPSSNYIPSPNPNPSSNPSSSSTNRAYRNFERKLPKTPFASHPGTAKIFVNHPFHTNTKECLQMCLLFSPNTPTFIQTLMTNTLIMLMSTYYTQHFHGHHFITSLIHYHYHYMTPHMMQQRTMKHSTLPFNNSTHSKTIYTNRI